MIDTLHKHGLCVSYGCIFRISQGLAEASIVMFEERNAASNMRHGVFTIGAKDIINKDSFCTLIKPHYHGISLSFFQFPSKINVGINRNYNKFVKIKTAKGSEIYFDSTRM